MNSFIEDFNNIIGHFEVKIFPQFDTNETIIHNISFLIINFIIY
jgi:hypothetical protein